MKVSKVTIVRLVFLTCAVIIPARFIIGIFFLDDQRMIHVMFVAPLHITFNQQANDSPFNDMSSVNSTASSSTVLLSPLSNSSSFSLVTPLLPITAPPLPPLLKARQRAVLRRKNSQVQAIEQRILRQQLAREKAICQVYTIDGHRQRPVTYNVLDNPVSEHTMVTMVTQMTAERFSMLDHIVNHWRGSISVALYTTEVGYAEFMEAVEQSASLRDRTNIYIHVVYAEGEHYPINFLRNVALEFDTKSQYVFLNDIDFVPSQNLQEMVAEYHAQKTVFQVKKKRPVALIIPAFEIQEKDNPAPTNKSQLMEMLEYKEIIIIGETRQLIWHQVTDYERWITATNVYEITWTEYFEPYLIIDRALVPRYQEQFVGRAFDKSTHAMQLYYLNFRFVVSPHTFVVHLPHAIDRISKLNYEKCAIEEYLKLRKLLRATSHFKHLVRQGLPRRYKAKNLTETWFHTPPTLSITVA